MIDAVDSGGYGVLGLYTAQAPAVPEPPVRPENTVANATSGQTGQAAPVVEPAQAVGSAALDATAPSDGEGTDSGRDYASAPQAQARQTAVAASLSAAVSSGTEAQTRAQDSAPSGAARGRAARSYTRTGQTSISASRPGSMFTGRA